MKLLFFLLFSFNNSFSQKNKKDSKNESSLYSGLKFRSVGPAFMSGRIAEIAINPENENEWYVAVGSGGAWKTVNAGTTWEPLTDNQSFYSTGSITIDIAIPKTARGNSISLSEKYSQLMLPVTNKDATIVSIKRFICTAAVPRIAGPINFIIFIDP